MEAEEVVERIEGVVVVRIHAELVEGGIGVSANSRKSYIYPFLVFAPFYTNLLRKLLLNCANLPKDYLNYSLFLHFIVTIDCYNNGSFYTIFFIVLV